MRWIRELMKCIARRRIEEIAERIELEGRLIESAVRTFLLAFQKRFTKGKKTTQVAIICLYFVCRKEKTGHMLVDLADAMEQNPFILSQLYIKFIRALNITQSFVDPTFYIQVISFISSLEYS